MSHGETFGDEGGVMELFFDLARPDTLPSMIQSPTLPRTTPTPTPPPPPSSSPNPFRSHIPDLDPDSPVGVLGFP